MLENDAIFQVPVAIIPGIVLLLKTMYDDNYFTQFVLETVSELGLWCGS